MDCVDWHLRFFLTPCCNFSCTYCNPKKLKENKKELSTTQIKTILQSAYQSGIQRIHWTGGEPTIKKDFLTLMKIAKEIGYTEQIITTNGWNLYQILDEAIENGLTRVNVSLDTLSSKRFKDLTGMNCFEEVIHSIKAATNKLNGYVKINVVTMQETLREIPDFIRFIQELGKDNVILKLICFNPNNPAQLEESGMKLYEEHNVTFHSIMNKLETIDEIEEVKAQLLGDNPNCNYYYLKEHKVKVGIIANPSWNYKCGGANCKKMRVTPFGEIANCIQDELMNIADKIQEEQIEMIEKKMARKELEDKLGIKRTHYRAQLGEVRFGKISDPIELNYFEKITKRD